MRETLRRLFRDIPGLRSLWHVFKRIWNPSADAILKLNNGFLHIFSRFARAYPPGHYYSTLPSFNDVNLAISWCQDVNTLQGIDLRTESQLEMLTAVGNASSQMPFPDHAEELFRYYFNNGFYQWCDGTLLYGFLLCLQPKHVIEVGSGFSSALMLDTRDMHNTLSNTSITFIEPYADRLRSLITSKNLEKCRIFERPVQEIELAAFDKLQNGDILFIDSSHVVKAGSDVCYLLFKVLPRLKPGVYIHFHDIFWPFEYPTEWFQNGRAWNESYAIRAFLQFNEEFEIILFTSYLQQLFLREMYRELPICERDPGSSLWLRRK